MHISDLDADTRTADPDRDSIDGVVPEMVVQPQTPAAVASVLAWAAERRLSVVLQGAGTKRRWGRRPSRIDMLVDLRRLCRVIDHRHGDLTVTVESGLTLRDLNAALRVHGQQLPLDPPFADRATIGGLLATTDSGPSRHRHGTPRDLVIGVQLATTDGKLTKAGGQVVKNVAGYDLSKLVCGSFGTLAAIVSATFKVSPIPAVSRTLRIETHGGGPLAQVVESIDRSQLEPLAFEAHVRRNVPGLGDVTACLLRFASGAAAVAAQADDAGARALAAGARFESFADEAEAALWGAHVLDTDDPSACVARVSWSPADLARVVALLELVAADAGVELIGRAGTGAGQVRITGDVGRQARAVERLRASDVVGNVVVTSATPELKSNLDVWGAVGNTAIIQAVKRAMDPQGTLGAGRAAW